MACGGPSVGGKRRQRGVALAIVVWFIAGMSLLAAGVVLSARMDTRLAGLHLRGAQATAAADGATRLFVADLLEERFARTGASSLPQDVYRLGDARVAVLAVPVELLLDVNRAGVDSWSELLQRSAATSAGNTALLADAIVQWPGTGAGGARGRRFESIEDLLSVDGFDRAGWDSLRDYVTVHRSAGGISEDLNALRQSMRLLTQIAPASRARRQDLLVSPAQQRNAQNLTAADAGVYRIDAMLRLDGERWLRRHWVSVTEGTGDRLPWRLLRSEPARLVQPTTGGSA